MSTLFHLKPKLMEFDFIFECIHGNWSLNKQKHKSKIMNSCYIQYSSIWETLVMSDFLSWTTWFSVTEWFSSLIDLLWATCLKTRFTTWFFCIKVLLLGCLYDLLSRSLVCYDLILTPGSYSVDSHTSLN